MFTVDVSAQLAAAREERYRLHAEINHLERVIAWLEQSPGAAPVEDCQPAVPPEPPLRKESAVKPTLKPRRSRTASLQSRQSSAGVRDIAGKITSILIGRSGSLSRSEIADELDLDAQSSTFKRALRQLVDEGKLKAEGQTSNRRYRGVKPAPHSERRAKVDASTERNAARMTNAVARVGLRDRVLKAIAADPGQLTTERLAQALDAHPDHVQAALEELMQQGKVEEDPHDYTYGRVEMAA